MTPEILAVNGEINQLEDASQLRSFVPGKPGLSATLANVALMRQTFQGWIWPSVLAKTSAVLAHDHWLLRRARRKLERHCIILRTRKGDVRIKAPLLDFWPAFEIFGQREYDFSFIRWEGVNRVVDVGAHVGAFCLWVSQRADCVVFAIEPNPIATSLFAENTAGLRDSVRLKQVAVAGSVGQRMFYDLGSPSTSSLLGEPSRSIGFQVDTLTLDDVIDESGFQQVDLLKMDIEGAENEVFRTVTDQTLQRIRVAMVECHPLAGADVGTVARRLARSGMRVACLERKAPLVVGWRHSEETAT